MSCAGKCHRKPWPKTINNDLNKREHNMILEAKRANKTGIPQGQKRGRMSGPHTPERAKRMSDGIKKAWAQKTPEEKFELGKRHRGPNNYRWKGGDGNLNRLIRGTFRYKEWREAIFRKNNYTCTDCGKIGGPLHAHHMAPFRDLVEMFEIKTVEQAILCEELWDLDNGFTLCKSCHKQTHDDYRQISKEFNAMGKSKRISYPVPVV